MTDPKLEAARRQADLARERLMGDAHALQARLAPAALAAEARLTVRNKAEEVVDAARLRAEEAVEAARERPAIPAAIAAGTAAILFRKPAYRLVKRLFGRKADAEESGVTA